MWRPHDITGAVNFSHLDNMVFARFLHCEVTVSPFLYSVLWNPVTKFSPYSRGEGERTFISLGADGGDIYVHYLEFFYEQDLAPLPYYLFIQSFIYSVLF